MTIDTIDKKIKDSISVIRTISMVTPFTLKSRSFINKAQHSLLNKIIDSLDRIDLSYQQKEEEVDIVMMGIYVIAMTAHQASLKDRTGDLSPYRQYPDPTLYHKSYFFYPKSYDEVINISGVKDTSVPEQHELMVLAVGTKIMNGELPFNPQRFKEILDKDIEYYTNHNRETLLNPTEIIDFKNNLDKTAKKINQKPQNYCYASFILNEIENKAYHAIEKIFNDALNKASDSNEMPEKKKLLDGINALKIENLANFTVNKPNFDFDNCVIIADIAKKLATQIGLNSLTQADVEEFINSTQKYKTCNELVITFAIIIGAVAGMIAGAAVGFVVGGVPGSIIGGVSGLVGGGGISGLSFTMWHTKNQPLNKITSTITSIIPQSQI